MIIDTHAHIVSSDQDKYPPSPLGGDLDPRVYDDPVTAERLLALMDANGVEKALLVQRAHIYGYDNAYVVDSANAHPDRFRAIVCLDAETADAETQLLHWCASGAVAGVRIVAPGLTSPFVPDPNLGVAWFAGEKARRIWRLASDKGLSVAIHFYRWNRVEGLRALQKLLPDFPGVRVVLDHASNVSGGKAAGFGVDADLAALRAVSPNVYQKVSTINLGRLHADGENLREFYTALAQVCGSDKIVWGSDIAQTKGAYTDMIAHFHSFCGSDAAEERARKAALELF